MRKLFVTIIASLPMFAFVLSVRAAGTEPPQEVARPPNPDFETGKKALEAGDYPSAIERFMRAAARDPGDASVQNQLGYAYRKSGNLDMAFKHYREALRLDPDHRGAHEYIGETWLLADNPAKAEEHLAALDKLCFFSCEEYRDLKEAIRQYKQRKEAAGSAK